MISGRITMRPEITPGVEVDWPADDVDRMVAAGVFEVVKAATVPKPKPKPKPKAKASGSKAKPTT